MEAPVLKGGRFGFSVTDRKAETLLPLIQDYIEPLSSIYSDYWNAYNRIDELDGCYNHLTVNHNQNFVDLNRSAHFQMVERIWREIKKPCRRCEEILTEDIDGYIAEYLWRYRCVLIIK